MGSGLGLGLSLLCSPQGLAHAYTEKADKMLKRAEADTVVNPSTSCLIMT